MRYDPLKKFAFYFSGIIFHFPTFVTDSVVDRLGIGLSAAQVRHVFVINPFFTYPELLRDVLMTSYDAEFARDAWIAAFVLAPTALVLGLVYFRGAENRYGRG